MILCVDYVILKPSRVKRGLSMSKISENFEQLLNEKQIPFKHQTIEDGHHLYRVAFQIQKSRLINVEIIIQETEEAYADGQIIYRHVHQLDDRAKEGKALTLINDLNEMRTGYYNLYLAGDGELFLRNLMRVGSDVNPFYQTLVIGSGIIRAMLPDIESVLGAYKK